MTLSVLHQDADVIAVDKPAGISVIPGRNEPREASLQHALEQELRAVAAVGVAREGVRIWVVHRLDRDVSGVLLFARNAEAHRSLSQSFEHGQVRKTYWALVDGVVEGEEGTIDLPLRTGGHGGRTVVDAVRGKPSRTSYRVVERFARFTVLHLEPLTGRTHQIRVHLRALGHPLAADRRYGRRPGLRESDLGPAEGAGAVPMAGGAGVELVSGRATLHALRLSASLDGRALDLVAPLPGELGELVRRLRSA